MNFSSLLAAATSPFAICGAGSIYLGVAPANIERLSPLLGFQQVVDEMNGPARP